MIKYALVGNIASGKSTMEKILENHGFVVLDTDLMAHDILIDNPKITETFKEYDVFEYGRLSRDKLGKLVFNNEELKTKLENIMHPLIKNEIETAFETFKDETCIFIAVPLLFEVHWESMFDKIVLVYSDDDVRLNRLVERNGYDVEYAKKRLLSQLPQDEKLDKSDYVIYNNGTIQDFEGAIQKFISKVSNI